MAVPFPVIDFSFSKLTDAELAQFKAAGGTGCACYGGKNVSSGKIVTPAYFQKVLSFGLDVIPIYEDNNTDYLQGYNRGLECGLAARAGWREIGLPDSWPIIFGGYDTGAQTISSNWPACFEFMRGYNDGCALGNGPMPAYVGTILGEQMIARGLIAWIWKPAASSWSNSVMTHVHMHQTTAQPYSFLNVPAGQPPRYDANEVIQPFYAQFPSGGNMAITVPEIQAIANQTLSNQTMVAVGTLPVQTLANRLNSLNAAIAAADASADAAKASADQAKTAATSAVTGISATKSVVDTINTNLGALTAGQNSANTQAALRDQQIQAKIDILTAKVDALAVGSGASPAEVKAIVEEVLGRTGLHVSP